MRGARPEIRTNLFIMLGSVWWNVLRSGGLRVMLVDMFCLGSIYTVTRRQVYLSPDPGTISLQCGPLSLVEIQRGSALIGRELQSVAPPVSLMP